MHSTLPLSAPSPQRPAWALRAQFFVSGALFATWGVHVPSVKTHYALGEQSLALAMLGAGVGALLALLQAGRLVARLGPRALSLLTGWLSCLAVLSLLAFDGYARLLWVLLGFGASASLFDVAINAEASELERRLAKPLMSGFHAMFSLGGMCGAALGSAAPGWGWSTTTHLGVAAGAGALVILLATPLMLPSRQTPAQHQPLSLPRGPLLLLGVLAAMGLVAEGALYDWSVLFMHQERGSSAATAALAYASFSGAMALGRLAGDGVRARMAPVRLLRVSGALAALGMGLALWVPDPRWGLLAFGLVGLGLSNVVPALFSAASRQPGISPAHGIAAVSSMGYLGMMAGPPLIGLVAEHHSLSLGLGTVVLFALVMAASARRALGPNDGR